MGLVSMIQNLEGTQERPEEYIRKGASLGDMGLVNSHGFFEYLLNIFRPVDISSFIPDCPLDSDKALQLHLFPRKITQLQRIDFQLGRFLPVKT